MTGHKLCPVCGLSTHVLIRGACGPCARPSGVEHFIGPRRLAALAPRAPAPVRPSTRRLSARQVDAMIARLEAGVGHG